MPQNETTEIEIDRRGLLHSFSTAFTYGVGNTKVLKKARQFHNILFLCPGTMELWVRGKLKYYCEQVISPGSLHTWSKRIHNFGKVDHCLMIVVLSWSTPLLSWWNFVSHSHNNTSSHICIFHTHQDNGSYIRNECVWRKWAIPFCVIFYVFFITRKFWVQKIKSSCALHCSFQRPYTDHTQQAVLTN